MINSKTEHAPKITTLEDAASMIESGDSIWVGSALSISTPFLDKLACRHKELQNITIVGDSFINCSNLLVDPIYKDTFHIVSLFEALPFNHLYKRPNNIEYVKMPCGPYPETIYEKFNINKMVFEVCPPDADDNCNLGFTGGAITPFLNKCKGIKIAIINEHQRATYDGGDLNSIPLVDLDFVCTCKHPIL